VVVGEGVRDLAAGLGARAFTTDRGTIAMPELRPDDPENLSLLFHEHHHASEGRPHGGEAEERQAQAREAFVHHLASEEGVTDVGEILARLESERDHWAARAAEQPGGTGAHVRAARTDRDARRFRRAARRSRRRNRRAARRLRLTAEDAVEMLLDAGFDPHGIVRALVERWHRQRLEERREASFRFAGRTVV